ncbi:agamous-like MADS-box protein AGL80 [Lathyrus oleraceus]|uniref:agamous-like MADS-box protein AGL80 n=1 Tax=Pisum sativum TaxID=3888 RepID=UPI001FC4AE76|nr:agamous-like MADS-box protein AGL80 [Pisum sativum]
MARIRKRKITSKLIENFSQRKMCYKTRLKGLFTKMEQVTTLCDLQACAVVFGPGDATPSMWPSCDAAEKLIHKFESMPEHARFNNVTDQLSFLKEKGKRLQATLDKIMEDNEDTLMGSYLYQIENESKSLTDFEPSVLNRLINFMLKKYKIFSSRVEYSEEDVSRENFGVFRNTTDPSVGVGEVFSERKFEGFNGGSSSRMFNEGKYGCFNGENYPSSEAFRPNMFGVLNGENSQSNLFPQGDLKGFYGIPTNDGSDMTMPIPLNINEENNNGRNMTSFNANFADNIYGNNFNNRFL